YLTQIDSLYIVQLLELQEVFLNIESNNRYLIKNSLGQKIYYAAEDSKCCSLLFCGSHRCFAIHITDNFGQIVMDILRPLRCSKCCFPCCLQELEVQAPPGTPVGYVIQNWHPYLPKFTIQNERREPVLKMTGPCVLFCFSDIDFKVTSLDETTFVGKIKKQWGGFIKEAFTDVDNYEIQFPKDLDVKIKAVLIGACFLIDFMFFEERPYRER
ncbi:phospholipid scramblase 1-like, partial [Polypterus senegalus]|uniref:phospholipid scramblase 1-like n=1 Tax=Polypterus senegalus TaxID=55291 RepID=UPI0019646495